MFERKTRQGRIKSLSPLTKKREEYEEKMRKTKKQKLIHYTKVLLKLKNYRNLAKRKNKIKKMNKLRQTRIKLALLLQLSLPNLITFIKLPSRNKSKLLNINHPLIL